MERSQNLADFIAIHNAIIRGQKNDSKIWIYILIGIIIIMGIIILYLISKPIIVNNAYEKLLKTIESKNKETNINTDKITPIINNPPVNIYDDFTNRYQNPSFF
uniref:Uncharacterized protein n=1 Tax=Moumouvirus sp. 'Monve' TaxID=1128131 RepID=H6WBE7_9VIRU|nr:hypothetical protein tv_L3 [Moumouvirus Monve]